MRAIVKEENKIEEYKNQSYDIEKLGVSGEIACTKTLMGSSGLSKSKAKALLQSTLMVRNMQYLHYLCLWPWCISATYSINTLNIEHVVFHCKYKCNIMPYSEIVCYALLQSILLHCEV